MKNGKIAARRAFPRGGRMTQSGGGRGTPRPPPHSKQRHAYDRIPNNDTHTTAFQTTTQAAAFPITPQPPRLEQP